ncbi:MAG TPA: hypothetical protein VFV26_05945 [Geothrix sp.]|nr:hypothetical protein [Geothrix sp.]
MTRPALRWTIPALLTLQLAMLWLQGAQLHRQNQALQGLREDIQALTDSLDAHSQDPGGPEEEGAAVPASFLPRPVPQKKIAVLGVQEEQEAASKEMQASRESAQKAVKDAREVQSKLSFEENARKADEAKKVQAATSIWQRWVYGALALVALAFVARAVIQRRG